MLGGEGVQCGIACASGLAKSVGRVVGGRIVVVSFMFGNVVGVGGHGDSGGTEGLESIDRRLVAVVLWKTVTRVGRPHEFVEIQKIASKTKVAAAEAGYRRRTTRLHRPSPRRKERKKHTIYETITTFKGLNYGTYSVAILYEGCSERYRANHRMIYEYRRFRGEGERKYWPGVST